ncbi:MAG: DUF4166 domain-containing protein [Roseibium sp.]|uniref:DUF4166 domain-containing protein n=1 Tax=Roseibium sp. TaxID=1936156 RepID=UPI003D9C28FB
MPRVLYQSILGESLKQVPPQIREMHIFARRAAGTANVWWGASPAARLICRLASLPQARDKAPIETSFTEIDGGERWVRRFDGQPFATDMIAGNDEAFPCMLERLGPFLFKMRVTASSEGIDLTPEHVFLGPVKIPKALAPKATGRERVVDDRYSLSVEVSFPLVGKVFGYAGTIEPCELVSDHDPAELDPSAQSRSTPDVQIKA